jgi:CubicO group peptidase (beta-lactamase class C family)
MTADMRSQVETEQVLTLLYNQPKPQVEPGKGYMYNNTDFALLRMVMEKASKQSLPDYLKKKLFEPLGMSSTFMNDDIEMIIPGLAENYYGYNPYKTLARRELQNGNIR